MIYDEDGIAYFNDEEEPKTVEEFLERLNDAGSAAGDFIVWVLGDSAIQPEVLAWLRECDYSWFSRRGVVSPDEFLDDEFRA